ncbi:hypothetical protein LJC61_04105 [Ruminococcaceae bacterium OttesenSCG-928-A16]|nr:hypothetical protein [Ruminococcaceae bacterium OttesenSCG-928-A16]
MAFIKADIKCPTFGRTISTSLYFPTDLPENVGNKVKGVITLLHGITNTADDWMMYSAAPRYAADNGYILVAPSADNSFYLDNEFGTPFYTLLTQELPAQLNAIFNIPNEREKNYIAGLSMGGYGALLLGLSQPQKYAAIGSFSGALDMAAMVEAAKQMPAFASVLTPLFGPSLTMPKSADLLKLVQQVATLPSAQQPRIFQTCGLQDNDEMQILTQNQNFNKVAAALPLDYTFKTWPGVHEWNFWDRSLAEFIGFIQNSDYAERKRRDWGAMH